MLNIYLVYYKPFKDSNLNKLEIFNELCVLACSYHMLLFTDVINDGSIKYKIGFSMIAFGVLSISVNSLIMVVKTLIQAKVVLRKLCLLFLKKINDKLKRKPLSLDLKNKS